MGNTVNATLTALIDQLGHANTSEYLNIRKKLLVFGDDAVEPLVASLEGAANKHVANTVTILGMIGTAKCLAPLLDNLTHRNMVVRMNVVHALRYFPQPEVVERLLERLEVEEELVQTSILDTLSVNGNPQMISRILVFLHGTSSETLRYTTLRVVAQFGNAGVLPDIRRYLDDDNQHVRDNARQALEMIEARGKPNGEAAETWH